MRLAFRAEIPKEDGSTEHVEEVSVPIRCSQPEGQPEILKMSSLTGSPDGGEEIIVIGMLKTTRFTWKMQVILFRQKLQQKLFHNLPKSEPQLEIGRRN